MLRNRVKSYWIGVLVIFLTSFVLIILNYRFGYYLIGGDAGAAQAFPKAPFFKANYVWSIEGLGTFRGFSVSDLPYFLFFLFLDRLGLPSYLSIQFYFFLILFISGLTAFYLVHSLLDDSFIEKNLGALAGAFFYMLNCYTMFIFSSSNSNYICLYALSPILLYLYIEILEKQKLRFIIYFLLLSIIGFSTHYAMVGMIILTLFSYFLYSVFSKGDFIKKTFLSVELFLLTLLIHLWRIIPVAMSGGAQLKIVALNLQGWLNWMAYRTSFLNLFRVDGYTGWLDFPYGLSYNNNPLLVLIGYGIFILAIFSVFWYRRKPISLYFLLLVLLGMFLAKSIHPPFGGLNQQMYNHIPGFTIFRSSYDKFVPMIVLGYAFLIGFSFINLFRIFREHSSKLVYIFTFIIICAVAFYAWPFWTGDVVRTRPGDKTSFFVKIPAWYFSAQEWANRDKLDYKILSLPLRSNSYTIYKWRYFGQIDPCLFDHSVINRFLNENTEWIFEENREDIAKILGLYNIKHILYHADTVVSEGVHDKIRELLEDSDIFRVEKKFGDLEFYRISDGLFLPHFYIPQNIIYSNNNGEVIPDIVSFGGWEIRSGIYLENLKPESLGILAWSDEIFVKADLEDPVSERELGEAASDLENVFFPYTRWKPGSLVYPLVLRKERWDERGARSIKKELFGKKLFYASKRISEIEKWQLTLDENDWEKTVERYKQKMEEAFEILEKIKQEEKENFFPLLANLEVSLEAHQGRLENLRLSEERKAQFENVFEKLEEKLNQIKIKYDFSRLSYKFDIPKEGEYGVYIKKVDIAGLEDWSVEVDGKKIVVEEMKLSEDGWISPGKKNFKEGEHELILHLPEAENLVGKNWQQFSDLSDPKIGEEVLFFSPQSIFPGSTSVVFQEIRDYTPNTIFRLTFDYKAQNGKAGFSIIQDTDKDEETGGTNPLITRTLYRTRGEEFEQAEILFNSSPRASLARLYLFAQPEEDTVVDVAFKNIKVESVLEPTVILRSVKPQTSNLKPQTPSITFVKVNPTKYRVKIEGAKEPYALVFSESFHKGWEAYVSDQQLVDSSQQYEDIVASYFDGEIEEGEHRNTFLEKATFETWGKKPIAEDRHSLVNGYANSWYITPEDSSGREDYELIIEFWPQRLFYIGLAVSGLALIGCLGYLGYDFVEKRRR